MIDTRKLVQKTIDDTEIIILTHTLDLLNRCESKEQFEKALIELIDFRKKQKEEREKV